MLINRKTTLACFAGLILILSSLAAVAADSHIAQAIKHAEDAVKATDGKTIAEHAELANSHVKTAEEHLKAGSKSLDDAIDHAKQGHVDLAKKAAEAAVVHLRSAQ